MSTSKRAIAWKVGRVFSIRLRNGHYALIQMLDARGEVAVFDMFRENDDWDGVKLSEGNVLFTGMVLRSVLKRSETRIHRDVVPVEGIEYETTRIHGGSGAREVVLWEGTPLERRFLTLGAGPKGICRMREVNGVLREEFEPISNDDYARYEHLEMTALCDYPSFNERLYLCEYFGRNFDPGKEIAFDRPLDPECVTYVDIIAGKTLLKDLGYGG